MKVCPGCKKEFQPLLSKQIYCSKKCFEKVVYSKNREHRQKKCELCPNDENSQKLNAHHPDYSEPEIVVTACDPCHELIHEKKRAPNRKPLYGEGKKKKTKAPQIAEPELIKAPGDEPSYILDSRGRRRYPHKYKYGKPNDAISDAEFQEVLDHASFVHPLLHKSYLVITAHIGSRRTEALEVLKENIRKDGNALFVTIPAKKFGQRGGEIELPLNWLGMNFVEEQWLKTRKGKNIWNFSSSTAWRIIKRVFPKKSPHHLRWNLITHLRELKDARLITTDEIKSWTGIKRDSTIEGYGLKTQAGIHKISEVRSMKHD